jgi:hypothetical protein
VRVRFGAGIHITLVVASAAMVLTVLKMLSNMCSRLWLKEQLLAPELEKHDAEQRALWWRKYNSRKLKATTVNSGL